jgi:hypothetical protein
MEVISVGLVEPEMSSAQTRTVYECILQALSGNRNSKGRF